MGSKAPPTAPEGASLELQVFVSPSGDDRGAGKYSSMRVMPFMAMFCVISTALVDQGVTISRRGPMN